MARGSFEDECWFPMGFTAWVSLPDHATPIPFETIGEALEVIELERWWSLPVVEEPHGQ